MDETPSSDILRKQITVTVLNKVGEKIDQFSMRGGMNLWVFLRKRGLPIGSACSGVGVCAACHLKITPCDPISISAKNEFESETLARNHKPSEERLACLCRVFDNITIQSEYW